MKKFPTVWKIYWQDAYVTLKKRPLFKKKHLTISVGWIVSEDKNFITLSNYYDGIGECFAAPFTVIPYDMVKSMEKLK